jgi:hypothetical protein
MRGPALEPGDVESHIAQVLGLSRTALAALHEAVIPAAQPVHRGFPQRIARSLARREISFETFAQDLVTLSDEVHRDADARRHVGWQADLNHTRGGYEVVFHEPGSAELGAAARAIEECAASIRRTLDAASVAPIANDLVGE